MGFLEGLMNLVLISWLTNLLESMSAQFVAKFLGFYPPSLNCRLVLEVLFDIVLVNHVFWMAQ